MRILIVSDTHGSVQRVLDIYKKLAKESPVDLIAHCGDYSDDALKIQNTLGKRVL
ncbi:MAG: metallophosphoesterase, partial [Firmicutes bacterium]|nr:metallophosphoesterase [Bacillota bacterium]